MTAPTEPGSAIDAAALAELNDLLQLDRDACEAYTVAIGALANIGRRETVMRFRADHERHVAELTRLIGRYGGTPAAAPHVSGALKLAMQKLGGLGTDREVMLAFKANEAQACERYTRAATHAATWPADVRDMISTAADDESRHYEWAEDQVDTLGVPPGSVAGRVASAVEQVHGRLADGLEAAETRGRRGLDAARRGVAAARARLPESLPDVRLPDVRLRDVRLPDVRLPDVRLPDRASGRMLGVALAAAAVGFIVTAALVSRSRR